MAIEQLKSLRKELANRDSSANSQKQFLMESATITELESELHAMKVKFDESESKFNIDLSVSRKTISEQTIIACSAQNELSQTQRKYAQLIEDFNILQNKLEYEKTAHSIACAVLEDLRNSISISQQSGTEKEKSLQAIIDQKSSEILKLNSDNTIISIKGNEVLKAQQEISNIEMESMKLQLEEKMISIKEEVSQYQLKYAQLTEDFNILQNKLEYEKSAHSTACAVLEDLRNSISISQQSGTEKEKSLQAIVDQKSSDFMKLSDDYTLLQSERDSKMKELTQQYKILSDNTKQEINSLISTISELKVEKENYVIEIDHQKV